jgi:hypothetical protein
LSLNRGQTKQNIDVSNIGRNLDDKTAITEELLKEHFTLANRPTLATNARKIKEKLDTLMVGTLGELRGAADGTWAALASLAPAVEEGLRLVFLTGIITSHHITSHHITSHHITSHHITSHHITSHHIT